MAKLCERPGCSEPGAAAYGMVAEDLLFWIALLPDAPTPDPNVLCRRHADAMVVPRGWTLDDRRDDHPRLFKSRPAPARPPHPPAARRRRTRDNTSQLPVPALPEQLQIDGTGEIPRPVAPPEPVIVEPVAEPVAEPVVAQVEPQPEPEPEPYQPWQPEFDVDDKLDGLLEVSSPLLARAFGGTKRRRG